jgi:hypothetical protein
MLKLQTLFVVALLCVSGFAGCGGTDAPSSNEPLASLEQGLEMCIDEGTTAGRCRTGYTCVPDTFECRKRCGSYQPACATGETCCLGQEFVDGSIMYPYCLRETESLHCYGGTYAAAP